MKIPLEDDLKEPVSLLISHRLPWLLAGLIGGIIITIISSNFEALLSKNISLAFFIPVIVYMSDAIGTQTQTIYVRNIGKEKMNFPLYFFKELFLGISLGLLFGFLIGLFAYYWFGNSSTALTVGLAMFSCMSLSPVIALIIPTIIQKEHTDPAVGAGPFTTIIQDLISLVIYFGIASLIIF